jgi:D-beta-D-heptose 7-phosphate kinase/D-beta-D-heptose 1-phosphate adenosyltransferase
MKSILKYPEDRLEILKLINQLKKDDVTIVFTNGVFDLLHIGHLKVLNAAGNEGDVLIVGLNSDMSVRELKGPDRPIVNQEDRSNILLNLKCVDYVIIFDDPSVYDLVNLIKPDVLVKGGDYCLHQVVAYEILQSYGGKVVLVPPEESRSTTRVIEDVILKSGSRL